MTDALLHPTHRVTEPRLVRSHWSRGRPHASGIYPAAPHNDPAHGLPAQRPRSRLRGGDPDPAQEAIQTANRVCDQLSPLLRALPEDLIGRLGLARHAHPGEWVAELFHREWHYPPPVILAR